LPRNWTKILKQFVFAKKWDKNITAIFLCQETCQIFFCKILLKIKGKIFAIYFQQLKEANVSLAIIKLENFEKQVHVLTPSHDTVVLFKKVFLKKQKKIFTKLKKYENNNFVIFKTVINLKKMIVPYFYDQ